MVSNSRLLWLVLLVACKSPERLTTPITRPPRPISVPTPAPQVHFVVDERVLAAQAVFSVLELGPGTRLHSRRYFTRDSTPIFTWFEKAQALSAEHVQALARISVEPGAVSSAALEAVKPGLAAFVEQLRALPEWPSIVAETQRRQAFCEAEWRDDAAESAALMQALTGLHLEARCFTVYLTYPGLPGGLNLGATGPVDCPNAILWGGHEDFAHYTTVYLWHEMLHAELPRTDTAHALIELATDNELRVLLGGAPYPPLLGHPELRETQERLLGPWQRYLATPGPRDLKALLHSVE